MSTRGSGVCSTKPARHPIETERRDVGLVRARAIVERAHPDRWDLVGVGLCLAGTVIILLGPR